MDDVLSAALKDSAEIKADDNSLMTISNLAMRQLSLAGQIEDAEERLKELNAQFKQISEMDLPNAMLELGMRSFKLEDGASISVEKFYGASIKVENRPLAYAWLEENGHGPLIKTDVVIPFGKGTEARADAKELMEDLKSEGFDVALEESVHHSTLKAFAKEQLEAGTPLPDLFTVFVGEKAKITLPKVKKKV